MQKLTKLWRYSMALLFFIVLIGFCIVQDGGLGGQLFGDSAVMYYLGLVSMLIAWLLVEISLAKPKVAKILIPISIVLVLVAATLINGYLSLIAGIILAGVISLYYLIFNKNKNTVNPYQKKQKVKTEGKAKVNV